MSSHAELDRALTVNEIVKRVPSAIVTLAAHGIDTCWRGHESLERVAAEAGVDPAALLAQIALAPRGLSVVKQCSGTCEDCVEKNR